MILGHFTAPLSVNSSDFQIHFVRQHSGVPAVVLISAGHTRIAIFAAKTGSRVLLREGKNGSVCGGKSKNHACKTRSSGYLDCPQAAVLVSQSAVSHRIPELLGVPRQTQHAQAACQVSADRETPRNDRALSIPALVMGMFKGEGTRCHCERWTQCSGSRGRWWWFPCAQIGAVSEFQWHEDRVFLLEAYGSTKEGIMLLGEIVLD